MPGEITYKSVNNQVLDGMTPPRPGYYLLMLALAGGIGLMFICWIYQIHQGMGVAGISHPVGWGVYISNFVFWVGIAHSGTLISAILYLLRAKWRTAVSRAAEAMTVFAVMTAGLFPMIHLGRFWVIYYIIPYPSQRQIWPNFMSPLVWDLVAVGTYFTVSVIFWYIGMVPDLASTRDRLTMLLGPHHLRTRIYRKLALGWSGNIEQWRNHGRAYLYFAALATPLVISVHSVVSWDFAVGLLPGWHSTIFAPYFVAGAIHSGLAMVLTLLIPLRRVLHLKEVITINQFDSLARTMIVTTLIVGYAYIIEPFIAWYSGDIFETQFAWWRATGWMAWVYWILIPLNVLAPLMFVFRKLRRNIYTLFIISILVNIGMWLERALIVISSTSHDFLPHNWGQYFPTWVEASITFGSFTFFLFWFFLFSKAFPAVAISDIKEELAKDQVKDIKVPMPVSRVSRDESHRTAALAIFSDAGKLLHALDFVKNNSVFPIEVYSPLRLSQVEDLLKLEKSPVRFWTLGGALTGLTGGFALAIGSALVNQLIVGGKHPVSIIPYCIVGFEGLILFGALGNLIGLIIHARLGRHSLPLGYDPRFSQDRFGLLVACTPEQTAAVQTILTAMEPEEIHLVR